MCVVTSQLVWESIVVYYEIYTSVMCKLEATTAHTLGNELFSEIGDVSCQVVKMKRICIFIDTISFNEAEEGYN